MGLRASSNQNCTTVAKIHFHSLNSFERYFVGIILDNDPSSMTKHSFNLVFGYALCYCLTTWMCLPCGHCSLRPIVHKCPHISSISSCCPGVTGNHKRIKICNVDNKANVTLSAHQAYCLVILRPREITSAFCLYGHLNSPLGHFRLQQLALIGLTCPYLCQTLQRAKGEYLCTCCSL